MFSSHKNLKISLSKINQDVKKEYLADFKAKVSAHNNYVEQTIKILNELNPEFKAVSIINADFNDFEDLISYSLSKALISRSNFSDNPKEMYNQILFLKYARLLKDRISDVIYLQNVNNNFGGEEEKIERLMNSYWNFKTNGKIFKPAFSDNLSERKLYEPRFGTNEQWLSFIETVFNNLKDKTNISVKEVYLQMSYLLPESQE